MKTETTINGMSQDQFIQQQGMSTLKYGRQNLIKGMVIGGLFAASLTAFLFLHYSKD